MTAFREALLGPSYWYHRRLIEQSKTWSTEKIREYQEERVHRLVRRYGDEITRKEDYREHLRRYSQWDAPLLTHAVRTSGSTGQPLRFTADTLARRQKERAYLFDIWSQIGFAPHDLRVAYRGDVHEGLVRYNRLENLWIISPSATMERDLDGLRSWVRAVPPFFLHVHASSLYTFIDLLGEEVFRRLPIRGIIAGSEAFPITEQARFERDFGIQIAHWYGHSEYAVLAYNCRKCRGFHFYPTYGYVEFLPSETEDCQRVVATSFNRVGTQFVRYDTGDLVTARTGMCTADRFPRVDAIVGRAQETFTDSEGRRRSLFGYIFGDEKSILWDHIQDLQVVQDRPGVLRIRLVTDPATNRTQLEQILRNRMPMATLEFEYVPVIDRTASGKRRYFVDAMADGDH